MSDTQNDAAAATATTPPLDATKSRAHHEIDDARELDANLSNDSAHMMKPSPRYPGTFLKTSS